MPHGGSRVGVSVGECDLLSALLLLCLTDPILL